MAAQSGGNNQKSNEFSRLTDEGVIERHKKAKGQEKVKLDRKKKARGLQQKTKTRCGGNFRSQPILMPDVKGYMWLYNCGMRPQSDSSCSSR